MVFNGTPFPPITPPSLFRADTQALLDRGSARLPHQIENALRSSYPTYPGTGTKYQVRIVSPNVVSHSHERVLLSLWGLGFALIRHRHPDTGVLVKMAMHLPAEAVGGFTFDLCKRYAPVADALHPTLIHEKNKCRSSQSPLEKKRGRWGRGDSAGIRKWFVAAAAARPRSIQGVVGRAGVNDAELVGC